MGVIAISREVGSFGDEIAAKTAEKLGFKLANRDHIHKMVQACDEEYQKACTAFEEEVKPSGFFERLSFSNPSFTAMFAALNLELASEGNIVMIGRGAQAVLAPVAGILKVRVLAPADLRVERIMAKRGLTREEALEFVATYGRERKALVESIYGRDLYDPTLFDLLLNTQALAVDDCVELVITAFQRLEAATDTALREKTLKAMSFAKKVESEIKKHVTTITSRDIVVEIGEGGAITLTGLVSDQRAKEKAGSSAAAYPGVTKVNNLIKTTQLRF